MFLLIGLGNPGKEYEKTRHNIGFMVIDAIADKYSLSSPKVKFSAHVSEGEINGHKVITLKPKTYMNRSGISVVEAVKFYKIPLENIIVFHDDIDLELGRIKTKIGGGSGGHNGIKDIDAHIGKEYKRVRIGVGHPGHRDDVSDYVLANFAKAEEDEVARVIGEVVDGVIEITRHNAD